MLVSLFPDENLQFWQRAHWRVLLENVGNEGDLIASVVFIWR